MSTNHVEFMPCISEAVLRTQKGYLVWDSIYSGRWVVYWHLVGISVFVCLITHSYPSPSESWHENQFHIKLHSQAVFSFWGLFWPLMHQGSSFVNGFSKTKISKFCLKEKTHFPVSLHTVQYTTALSIPFRTQMSVWIDIKSHIT